MAFSAARPVPTILAAALIAVVIAGYDVVATMLAMLSAEGTGRVFGTLLRDAMLVVGGVMLLRRAKWAAWMTGALFALTLLRVLAADDVLPFAVNLLALPGLVLLLLPASRAWWNPAPEAGDAPVAEES